MKTVSFDSVIWKSSTAMKLLTHFMENPTREFYGKEIAERTDVSVGAAHNHLKKLSHTGLLKTRKKGRMTFYKLKKENEIIKKLKTAYNLSKPLNKKLKEVGKKLDVEIYLYGSVARGEDTKGSDWDLLVIGDVNSSRLQGELDSIETDETLKPSLYSPEEWNRVEEEDPAFYERVEKDKIRLV